MNRYCFQLQVAPQHIDEYRRRHAQVWPDMLNALREAEWSNYSLFLRPDGLLIGYFESRRTLVEVEQAMAQKEVNTRWQREMAPFFVAPEGATDAGLVFLEEVFNLESQLDMLS